MKERDIIINIDKCRGDNSNSNSNTTDEFRRVGDVPVAVADELGGDGEKSRNVGPDKEKRVSKKKKSPKPPRPPGPRGCLSLDAADQKLIKELLMIKQRADRIKAAFRKTKPPPSASSSTPNFIAMLFTILFCLLIVFQGCHSSGIWPRNASHIGHVSTSSPNPNSSVSEVGSINLMGMQVPHSGDDKGGKATY